jgi:hypothetical protein
MIRLGSRHFAAVVAPTGIHLIEYRRGLRRLQVLQYVHSELRAGTAADMVSDFADLLETHGGVGARLSIAIGGFGSFSHILSLPIAPAEVLHPVVMRELRHVYPELRDAVVAFRRTNLHESERKPHAREHQLLVGVMQRDIVSLLQETMSTRGIALEHITTLPRALQQVHGAFVDGGETMALIIDMPRSPLIGFFNRDGLQFFSTPPGPHGSREAEVQPVTEQVERGALFLRQQSRGQGLDRVLIAGEAGARLYSGPLQERELAPIVDALEHPDVPPGALAAFGVALDARSGTGLNLLPAGMRPAAEADPWVLHLAVATATILIVASAWWGLNAVRTAEQLESRVEALASQLSARTAPLSTIRPVVADRQAHTARVDLLVPLEASRVRLQDLLWSTATAPGPIVLDSLSLRQEEGEWRGTITGAAIASNGAVATEAVNDWYGMLAASFVAPTIRVHQFANAQDDSAAGGGAPGGPVQIDFGLSVAVPISTRP